MINHIYGVVNTKCKNFLLFLPVIFDTYASFCASPRLAGGATLPVRRLAYLFMTDVYAIGFIMF